jgi:hypothetical protein
MRGTKLLVYPRVSEMSSAYTGCQSLWAPKNERWELITLIWFEGGGVVRVWSPGPPREPEESCRFERGRVVAGKYEECPMVELIPIKTTPPGCFERIRAGNANGLSWPKECEMEP